jgi:hypothetical protein
MARGPEFHSTSAVLLAGLAAATTVEAYLFAVGLATWPGTYQWIASALWGREAYTAPSFAWAGVAMHVAVSLAWALAWAAAATRWPHLLARPLAWGLGYGMLVFVVMQGMAFLAGIWATPTRPVLFHYVVDHAVFFGVPVAVVYGWATGRPGVFHTTFPRQPSSNA